MQGREVVAALNASKTGPWLGQVLSKVVEWQLEHPAGSKTACLAWLEGERANGHIVAESPPKRDKGNPDDGPPKKIKKNGDVL